MKLSELKNQHKLKCLVYGDSGTGKTCFLSGFPTPLAIADFDRKSSSAASFWKDSPERLGAIEVATFDDPKYSRFNQFYNWLAELEKNCPYATVGLDSLTTFYDEMMKEIIKQNPNGKRLRADKTEVPILSDYNLMNHYFKQIVTKLLALPCHIVVTAHIQRSKDELTGEILHEPALSGKLAVYLPIVFEEVYRIYVKGEGNQREYLLQTQKDSRYLARSQLSGIQNPLRASWENLVKIL
jgi:phage nucleotide-binding protein